MTITKNFDIGQLTLADLRDEVRWCAWESRLRSPDALTGTRKGADAQKVAKIAIGIGQRFARSNDPSTWLTLRDAQGIAGVLTRPYGLGGVGVFLGPVGSDSVLIGADFDGCLDESGKLADWAADILATLGPVYCELSPSGKGLKTFMLVRQADFASVRDLLGVSRWSRTWKFEPGVQGSSGVEVHTGNRWFAVTGKGDYPLGVIGTGEATAFAVGVTKWFPASRGLTLRSAGGDVEVTDTMIEQAGSVIDVAGDGPDDLTGEEQALLARLPAVAGLWAGNYVLGDDKSLSAAAWRLGGELRRAGVAIEPGIGLMMKCPWLWEWYAGKGEWEGRRQVARAWWRHEAGVAERLKDVPLPVGIETQQLRAVGADVVQMRQRYDVATVKRLIEAAAPAEAARLLVGLVGQADLDALDRDELCGLVAKRAKVSKAAVREQIKVTLTERVGANGSDAGDPDSWRGQIQCNSDGEPLGNLANAMTFLRNAPELAGMVNYDVMMRRAYLNRRVPDSRLGQAGGSVQDNDVSEIQEWLQRQGLPFIGRETVQQAVNQVAEEHRFHPVQDYLNGLVWDGKPRLDTWLRVYLGAKQQPAEYLKAIGRMFLLSMVYRVMEPGCQCDYMVVLEGDQGLMKTTACNILAGDWFSNSLPDLHGPDDVRLSMHLRGKWLIEIGELSSFRKADMDKLKAFVTRRVEQFTPKFGRNDVPEPRQCVFICTTNDDTYLKDDTGNRRFWPAKIGAISLDKLKTDRDQLFAEATQAWRNREQYWPDKAFEANSIRLQQDSRFDVDPWEEHIIAWLQEPGYKQEPIVSCLTKDIAFGAIKINASKEDTITNRRISAIMRRLGWKKGEFNRWVNADKDV